MNLEIIVLAAGHGTRMKSRIPKVLHEIGGKPMLTRVLDTVASIDSSKVHVVVGGESSEVKSRLGDVDVNWVTQTEQRGTGHAVLQALPYMASDAHGLVIYGDCPLASAETLNHCATQARDGIGLVTANMPDPTGFGRIVRDADGALQAIVEQADLTPTQCSISEVNSGIVCAPVAMFRQYLPLLSDENAQGELYLTDLISMAVLDGVPVQAVRCLDHREVLGVNDRVQLAEVERHFQKNQAVELMKRGVHIVDPMRFDCRGSVSAGTDCSIDINAILAGDIELGDNVTIGANCILRDVQIASHTEIRDHTVIEDSTIGQACTIGPFARIRPGSQLADDIRIGNFVEVKNSQLANGVRASHLAYLGDATVGTETNVGAGSITCNFDGKNKHRTIIGDNVFIGSNSSLIAPLTIEAGAAIAAGSSISRKVNADELVIERGELRQLPGGGSRFRKR